MSRKIVLLASFGPSLTVFRGDLIRNFLAEKWSVVAVAPLTEGPWLEEVKALGARYRPIPLDRSGLNPVRDVRTLLHLIKMLREEKPDVILSYTAKPVMYGSLAATVARVPHIVSMITGLGSLFVSDSRKARLSRPIFQWVYGRALSCCDRVIFQNGDDQEFFQSRGMVDEGQCESVAGSGVNLQYFAPSALPQGKIQFLMIARLLADKGIREFVNAARLLRERGLDTVCDLVGPLENHPRAIPLAEVEEWVAEGIIRWHGGVYDVRPFLRACTVYVLPSYREGTPRSVLEAMAMGRPVITTDAPGCRETVIHGVNGFLVPVRDHVSLADAMQQCMEQRSVLQDMGSASLQLAKERFDVVSVNQKMLQILGVS